MVLRQFALLDAAQETDGADGVLVNGVMVVHVELHLRVDAAEIGYEPTEYIRLVHPAQNRFGVVLPRQHLKEQRIGARIIAQGSVDQAAIAIGDPHGLGMHLQLVRFGKLEYLDEPNRIGGEPVVRRRGDTTAMNDVALQAARSRAKTGEKAPSTGLLRKFIVDMRQEDTGECADPFRLQEVELHETFDGTFAGPIRVIHPLGDAALQVEGQPVFRPPGQFMEMASHGQQPSFGAPEVLVFIGCEQAHVDQFRRAFHAVYVFADPVEGLKIAEPALPLLYVGLHDIATVAHAFVPFVAFGQLVGDELSFRPPHDVFAKETPAFVVERLVPPHVAPFEQGRPNGEVGLRHPDHFFQSTRGMTDLQTEVPQEVERGLDHLFAPRRGTLRHQERYIHIRMRSHFRTTVTTHGQDRNPLRLGAIGCGIKM